MKTKPTLGAIGYDRWTQIAATLRLTKRERQIAELICAGVARKQIADTLGVTVGSVNALSSRLYKKAGCNDRLTFLFLCHDLANADTVPPPQGPST
jgi:DNA-binding NarL/FixJ family response regulator